MNQVINPVKNKYLIPITTYFIQGCQIKTVMLLQSNITTYESVLKMLQNYEFIKGRGIGRKKYVFIPICNSANKGEIGECVICSGSGMTGDKGRRIKCSVCSGAGLVSYEKIWTHLISNGFRQPIKGGV